MPEYGVIGVAGVVNEGRGEVTNLPWLIDGEVIAGRFGLKRVELINDLTAVCASLPLLSPAELMQIQAGQPVEEQLIGVVAPGTGLGEGLLVKSGDFFFPRGSEGGHADFAPVDELQTELLQWMRKREEQVSYESLIAGPGIPRLYDFLHQAKGLAETARVGELLAAAADRSPVIFTNAFGDESCPLCRQVVELFLSILGSEAGNLALKLYARGGMYLGGGILPRLAGKVSFAGFLAAFQAKGKMQELMRTIPVRLILKPDAALIGAAHYGRVILCR